MCDIFQPTPDAALGETRGRPYALRGSAKWIAVIAGG